MATIRSDSAARQPRSGGVQRSISLLVVSAAAMLVLVAVVIAGRRVPEPTWMGMEIEELTPELRSALAIPRNQPGVFVSDVVGPAFQSGVQEGDVIYGVGGYTITGPTEFAEVTSHAKGQSSVRLDIIRDGVAGSIQLYPSQDLAPQAAPESGAMPVAWSRGNGLGYGPGCGLGYGPGNGRCWAATPGGVPIGGLNTGALPPGCATCPGAAGCFPPPGGTLAAFPQARPGCPLGQAPAPAGGSPGGYPMQQVALPCNVGACPLP